jgi:hypothetical protein
MLCFIGVIPLSSVILGLVPGIHSAPLSQNMRITNMRESRGMDPRDKPEDDGFSELG